MLSNKYILFTTVAAAFVAAQPSFSVKTGFGAVNGVQCASSGSNAFLSIPYANPAWTYRFEHQPTCGWYMGIHGQQELDVLGATHTAEILYVFSQLTHLAPPSGTCDFDAQEVAISKAMVSVWTFMAAQ
jgi:carboxylesterase type B